MKRSAVRYKLGDETSFTEPGNHTLIPEYSWIEKIGIIRRNAIEGLDNIRLDRTRTKAFFRNK